MTVDGGKQNGRTFVRPFAKSADAALEIRVRLRCDRGSRLTFFFLRFFFLAAERSVMPKSDFFILSFLAFFFFAAERSVMPRSDFFCFFLAFFFAADNSSLLTMPPTAGVATIHSNGGSLFVRQWEL